MSEPYTIAPKDVRKRHVRRVLAGLLFCMPMAAQAQDNWEWRVAPYLWGSALSGTAATVPGLPPVDVDASFSDILDNLDFAGMIAVRARNGRWGISGDLQYIKLNAASGPIGPNYGQAQAKIKNTIVSLFADYQVSQSQDHELWVSGGLRHWSVTTDLTFTPGALPGRTANGSDDWVDPVIGFYGRKALGERTYVSGWAYAGGFGAGSESMVDVFGGFGYQFTPTTSGVLGYRYMAVDRRNGSFVYDMKQQGPLMGVVFNF
ncbi:hypothetical protein [Falsiruegeria mediterranea]|uniref:Outer membrane protein beta-barrel domain-containing protein n=1 Tax=Falsiruegeria mediterranea M17 TaxID=1200281 RepID=A0A2R8CE97_9RHOB|nr:hypothetical protein [Falsiruegeria mediterranea]SPJ30750.1 hypothetical protein TRM7615_04284 [Falsiruegeria mediterranea M17]